MPARQDPRKHLVEAALKLFASHGYYHTSIADIVRESGCTKGMLYYHFRSKEELGYAAVDEAVRLLVEQGAASHLQTNGHPIDRVLGVLHDLPCVLKLETTGSLAAGVGARMACVHDGFRQRLVTHLAALAEEAERMMVKGVADGQIADSVDPHQLAHAMVIMAHGLQMASLLGQREVILEDAQRWLKEYLNSLRT